MTKLGTILDQVDAGSILLPEFQRGYVWNRDQVRGLMRSLYLGHPVGALLVWETDSSTAAVRGDGPTTGGQKQLLLDGQQRVTTVYGIVRGRPPSFFEGDPTAFEDLRFNVETEAFQFHAPTKMRDDPRWVDVTALFTGPPGAQYRQLFESPELSEDVGLYMDRLSKLQNILQREFFIEQITGADKTVDVVVDIFNRVNSGGTKLSKGDLALARICAEWGDARPTMRRNLDRWAQQRGLKFTADWLLRNVNATATGRAPFSALEDVSAIEFQDALFTSLHNIDHVLDLLAGRLGLDHDRVLMGRYAIPVMNRLLHNRGGRFADRAEADKVLYWYVHAALRGRFAGSTETVLAKDLETADAGGIDGVIASLSRSRKGNMGVDAQDFEGVGRGSRAYPLLYLLTRVLDNRDLGTGWSLRQHATSLEVHEIFPKAQLTKQGYPRAELNAIANFAFVTPSSATDLTSLNPAYYLRDCSPEVLASQWIPQDPQLWEVQNYREFLDARRELLAAAANDLLTRLHDGALPHEVDLEPVVVTEQRNPANARTAQITALVEELAGMGYTQPALDAEIPDPDTGRPLAVAEAFWAEGLQAGQGSPVVLALDPDQADLSRLSELGCEVFTSVDALRAYVERRNEVASGERELGSGVISLESEPTVVLDVELTPAGGDFDRAVLWGIERCREELHYNPRYFRVMVTQHGALGATRKLLHAPAVSDGFVSLWERNRLDLTVEALVSEPRFAHLFTDEERQTARKRLADFGYALSA